MFYEHPEMKGSIRNIRQYYREAMKRNVWSYEIYLDNVKVYYKDCDWWNETKEDVIREAKEIGEQIRKEKQKEHELNTVKDKLYVKAIPGVPNKYSIYVKGRPYCVGRNYDSVDEALVGLEELEIQIHNDLFRYKHWK